MPPTTAYIALGANLGDREASLRRAVARLQATAGVRVLRVSSFLENPAVGGPPDAPAFVNAVAAVETTLPPRALLGKLLDIERDFGRERDGRNGPRPIDLDLVLYGEQTIDEPDLKVPHPRMTGRRFVLQPLAEIAPDAVHPRLGRKVTDMLADLPTDSAAPRLRPVTNRDVPAVRELVFSVLDEYGLKSDPSHTDADLADLEKSYLKPGGMFDVLETADGAVVGSVGLYPLGDGVCELRKMYLLPAYRGRGLGKLLLEHALARAEELGFNRVVLETATVLKEAVTLYRSYGFQSFQAQHVSTRCDQTFFLDL